MIVVLAPVHQVDSNTLMYWENSIVERFPILARDHEHKARSEI
jgi:hypothetical protein